MEKTILSSKGLPKHIQIQKSSFTEDDTAFIEAIPGIVFAVVISYVYLNVGTYMNGTIGSELVDSFPNNLRTGLVNLDIWHNGSVNGTYVVNLTSPNTAEKLDQTTSKVFLHATGAFNLYWNLTINGVAVNTTSFFNNSEGYNHTMSSLITGGSVVHANDTLTFQWDANSTDCSIEIRIYGTYYANGDLRTGLENSTVGTIGNVSANYDSNVNIIKIAITISVLLVPIMAIMTFRRVV